MSKSSDKGAGRLTRRGRLDGRTKEARALLSPSRPSQAAAIESFFATIDKRELRRAASLADGHRGDKLQLLADCLADPAFRRYRVSTLCGKVGLTIKDLTELWRDHQLGRGIVRMFKHVPEVLEDVAVDAKSRTAPCKACAGIGRVMAESGFQDCKFCKGTGGQRTPGDQGARELVFETAGLTGKKGPLVAQQFNFGDSPEEAAMATSRLIEEADKED